MRVVIAGAGNVGLAIAGALLADEHRVLLIERHRPHYRPHLAPEAVWMLADACELDALREAGVETADVAIAATADDKVNVVFAQLCKTQFGVARVLARVNQPGHQWLFTPRWGVDIAVSTSEGLIAGVEEVVESDGVVRLMSLRRGQADLVQVAVPSEARLLGQPLRELRAPDGTAVIGVGRHDALLAPEPDLVLEPADKIILLAGREAGPDAGQQLRRAL